MPKPFLPDTPQLQSAGRIPLSPKDTGDVPVVWADFGILDTPRELESVPTRLKHIFNSINGMLDPDKIINYLADARRTGHNPLLVPSGLNLSMTPAPPQPSSVRPDLRQTFDGCNVPPAPERAIKERPSARREALPPMLVDLPGPQGGRREWVPAAPPKPSTRSANYGLDPHDRSESTGAAGKVWDSPVLMTPMDLEDQRWFSDGSEP